MRCLWPVEELSANARQWLVCSTPSQPDDAEHNPSFSWRLVLDLLAHNGRLSSIVGGEIRQEFFALFFRKSQIFS